jgi:Fe-S-cluster containining protein
VVECAAGCGHWQRNADFMTEHWTVISGSPDPQVSGYRAVRCDVFDPATRLCGAYEQRPPVCSGYPHYGSPLTLEEGSAGTRLPTVCTFNAEIRTMLPIVAVT